MGPNRRHELMKKCADVELRDPECHSFSVAINHAELRTLLELDARVEQALVYIGVPCDCCCACDCDAGVSHRVAKMLRGPQ